MNILILYKVNTQKKIKRKKLFLIDLNLAEDNKLFAADFESEELMGRLKNARYCVLGGHMYYNNNIIKIRYDVLRDKTTPQLTDENQLLDYY